MVLPFKKYLLFAHSSNNFVTFQMREEAERLEGDLSKSRNLVPRIQMDQDDLRGRMATMDPNSPEYVSRTIVTFVRNVSRFISRCGSNRFYSRLIVINQSTAVILTLVFQVKLIPAVSLRNGQNNPQIRDL